MTTDIATTPASLQLLSEAAAGGPISQTACSGTGSMSPVVATVVVDPRGQATTYRFNGIGALVSLTDALGRTTSFTYEASGNVLTVTDGAGGVWTRSYEPTFNKVASVRDPLNQVTTFGYDGHGNLTTMTDPLGHVTTRTYDGVARLLSQANPLGYPTSLAYDVLNRVTRITDPNAGMAVSPRWVRFNGAPRIRAVRRLTFRLAHAKPGPRVVGALDIFLASRY